MIFHQQVFQSVTAQFRISDACYSTYRTLVASIWQFKLRLGNASMQGKRHVKRENQDPCLNFETRWRKEMIVPMRGQLPSAIHVSQQQTAKAERIL